MCVTFTAKENEVLSHLLSGRRNYEIAKLMGISAGTVKHHIIRMCDKRGINTDVYSARVRLVFLHYTNA